MNKDTILHIGRFILLVLLQVLVFNHINFLGDLNPYVYIIFILFIPITINKSLFLFISFVLGLTMDIFGDSGGVHAAACLVITFFRPVALRSVFGLSYEFQTMKLSKIGYVETLIYVTLMVLTHHIVLFSLEFFNLSHILPILKKTLFSSLFTIVIIMLVLVLFKRKSHT